MGNFTHNMIEKWLFLTFSISECSKIPSFGKITIENKSDEIIRVNLVPVISWNYVEQRTNQTMLRNPDKTFGGNHILPGYKKYVYFPGIFGDSIGSSHIQL